MVYWVCGAVIIGVIMQMTGMLDFLPFFNEAALQFSDEQITMTVTEKYIVREGFFGSTERYHFLGNGTVGHHYNYLNQTQYYYHLKTFDDYTYHTTEVNQTKSFTCKFNRLAEHDC